MTEDEQLAHSLRLQFGLPPDQPNTAQLASIKAAIKRIRDQGGKPTHSDWDRAVSEHCRGVGKCSYGGVDNSDLNVLLALAIAEAKKVKK